MLSPSDLYEIRKIIVASKLLDSGAFDADLARIEASNQAACDAQAAAIAATNDRFIAQAAKMQDELDAKEAALQVTLDDIASRSAALDAKQTEYNNTAADVGAKLDLLASMSKKAQEATDAMYAEANTRTNKVEKREKALADREAALVAGQADLASKLAALKAISA